MSNEQKHTPGPWRIEAYTNPDGETGPEERALVWGGDEAWALAICEHWGNDRHDAEANARLIAAAPELLEALEKIVECERNRAKDLRHREAWLPLKFSEERIAAAEVAIAKAKGVTQ